jgi:hypothetical protein
MLRPVLPGGKRDERPSATSGRTNPAVLDSPLAASRIPPQGSSYVAHAVVPASYARDTKCRGLPPSTGPPSTPSSSALRRKNPPQRSGTAAHQVDTEHRGRLVTPAVREPVNATDIGELTPRLTQRGDAMTCQLGAADANDRTVWTATLRYPTSLPPPYPIRSILRGFWLELHQDAGRADLGNLRGSSCDPAR